MADVGMVILLWVSLTKITHDTILYVSECLRKAYADPSADSPKSQDADPFADSPKEGPKDDPTGTNPNLFDQFEIKGMGPLINNHIVLMLGVMLVWVLVRGNKVIPKRWQAAMESVYNHFGGLVKDNSGAKYFPFVLTLFIFIVSLNVLGLFPYVFTVTAHVVVTLGLSCSIIMGVTKGGLWKFKWNFFSILMPAGAPLVLTPLLALIETVSYVSRVISLGVRLAANLSAGHLLFAILAGFCFNMSSFLFVFPVFIMVFISLLESAVAVIQAYVFSLLTSIYLADTLVLH